MSDILCRWLNSELQLSKSVDPRSFSKDFANGYLIGEVLHKYQLQDDFDQFSKSSTSHSKLNNFSRVDPTLHLLGVPFALARAVMLEQPGAATDLLNQLYVVLLKTQRKGLTGVAMEMQPAATSRLQPKEREIYTGLSITTAVEREADLKLPPISLRYELQGRELQERSLATELEQEQEGRRVREELRLREVEKRQSARQRQHEIVTLIPAADIHVPKPPARPRRALERQQQFQRQLEAENVKKEIAQFEGNKKTLSAVGFDIAPFGSVIRNSTKHFQSRTTQFPGPEDLDLTQANSKYIQTFQLKEDVAAWEQRERRRRLALVKQLQAHEAKEEALRDAQLMERINRQSLPEKRLAVQLMQVRQQKEVLRQNRIFRERQRQERQQQNFQEALEQEAALAHQARLNHMEETRWEKELYDRNTAKRAKDRYNKDFIFCREVLEQIVDLSTRVGEYCLFTDNLIPSKLIREWKEILLQGHPLYPGSCVDSLHSEPIPEQLIEMEKLEILNNQDYYEYINMEGEWTWPEEGGAQKPPPNNNILGGLVRRLQDMINPPKPETPPSFSPHFTLKACVLGKLLSGKTTCLARISQALGIHVLSPSTLLQEALTAFQTGELAVCEDANQADSDAKKVEESPESGPLSQDPQQLVPRKKDTKPKLSVRAQQGETAEKILRKGRAVPNDLLVEIIVEAIRQLPAESGWVLDGFPVELSQAKLLEKALGGLDLDKDDRKRHRKSTLAVDPNAPKEPPPPLPVLDLALLLDVSDKAVLRRAAEQAFQQDSGVEEKGLEKTEIQNSTLPRITAFHDTWPELEGWFSGKQIILMRLNAEEEEEMLFRKVFALFESMMQLEGKDCQRDTSPSEKSGLQPGTCVLVEEPLPEEIAKYLVPYWENICNSYETNIKTVMQNLRIERDLIIEHLYNVREEFKHYLKRPDLKQEFVSQWQQDYNSIPDDMRADQETKAELHQRLDDLREKLWDICDRRKEKAEMELAGVTGNGWLEDHTALLINFFSILVQGEVDRFQDSLRLLRDYYRGMSGQVVPDAWVRTTHISLLKIVDEEKGAQSEAANLARSERMTKSPGKRDGDGEEKKKTKMRPPSTEAVSLKKKGVLVELPPNEKLVHNIWQVALRAINDMVLVEVQQRKAEENEEAQLQTARDCPQSARTRRGLAKKKGGAPSPVQEPSPPPPVEKDLEVQRREMIAARIRQEYAAALDHEERAVKVRLERINMQVLAVVQRLQCQTEQAYCAMEEWLGAHYLAEMTSIDQLVKVVGHHIELATKLEYDMVLTGTEFYLDGDVRVVPHPLPPPRPPPLELPVNSTFTVLQLEALHTQLRKVSPTGLLSKEVFSEILLELTSLNMWSDALPDPWMHLSEGQILEMVSVLTQDSGVLDWRHLLLSAALPWPVPSKAQLLQVLTRFQAVDPRNTGRVTEEQYLQTELWFPSEMDLPIPEDPLEPMPYDRLANLRKFFFTLFADDAPPSPQLDYVTMLLYFASHPDPIQGFVRALSVVVGHPLHHRPSSPLLLKSVPYIKEELSDCTLLEGEVEPTGSEEGKGVSIPALLRVVYHGGVRISSNNRFHHNLKGCGDYKEELRRIYRELGFGVEEEIPFAVLSQHPLIQDLMESSLQYHLADIHQVFQARGETAVTPHGHK